MKSILIALLATFAFSAIADESKCSVKLIFEGIFVTPQKPLSMNVHSAGVYLSSFEPIPGIATAEECRQYIAQHLETVFETPSLHGERRYPYTYAESGTDFSYPAGKERKPIFWIVTGKYRFRDGDLLTKGSFKNNRPSKILID